MNQGKGGDEEYKYIIEKIYIKELKRNEITNYVIINLNNR